jgi:lipoic acid synthetase
MGRIPDWMKAQQLTAEEASAIKRIKEVSLKYAVHTLHAENIYPLTLEYYKSGVPTFLIMGDVCSRSCKFCYLSNWSSAKPKPIDAGEAKRLADAIAELELKHVVITSVCRDDIYDGGVSHFADCISTIKSKNKDTVVEAVIPDFQGKLYSIKKIISAQPDIICHNIETVKRLYKEVMDSTASYDRSLLVLKKVKELAPSIKTKSSLFLGLGEKEEDILETLRDIRSTGVEMLSIGQYVQPSALHIKTKRFVEPSVFENLRQRALDMGFIEVESNPFGRNPYNPLSHLKRSMDIMVVPAIKS